MYLGRLSGIAGFEKFVAIKVIHPHLVTHKNLVDMFLDEARLSARIHHPNVVETFEVGEEDGLYYLVAELVRGQSLRRVIEVAHETNRHPEPPLYMTIIALVCDALHAAHTAKAADGSPLGLVHRDISPSNIMISYDGMVKLIDFGIAIAEGRIANETESGVVKGKLDYMSPEQLRRRSVDRRSDIFSVGVVLYELATGRHPFWGEGGTSLERQLKSTPSPPRKLIPNMAPNLELTILKALSENPAHRHQTAKDLSDELRNLISPEGALVDRQIIADLMSELFAQQIGEEPDTIETATHPPPSVKERYLIEQDRHSSQNDRIAESKASRYEAKAPATDILAPSFEDPKPALRHRPIILLVFVVAACLIVIFAWLFGYQQPEEKQSENPSVTPELPTRDNVVPPSPIEPEPSATSDQVEASGKTAKILLKNLPESAQTTLDGADATVVEGELTVPADGVERLLEITAEGYLPYRRKIRPTEDSEMTIELKKKKAKQRKHDHTKSKKQKKGPNNTLQSCPYCD